jgi:glycosyltransferase involved in cell wall biosynthesis
MIHERFPSLFVGNKTARAKHRTITQATHIIAISEWTKRDLMELYGMDGHNISVVYHGVDANALRLMQPVANLPETYVLFTGQRSGYKNFMNFLDAMAIVLNQFKEVQLICTGPAFTPMEVAEIQRRGLNERVRNMFVNQNQLSYLYHHALCFVFPSIAEGFGFPILEAFAAECPIALSRSSCFPEIADEAGLYFDPNDPQNMADVIVSLISDEKLAQNMRKLGAERVKLFTWQRAAHETAEVYRKVLKKKL